MKASGASVSPAQAAAHDTGPGATLPDARELKLQRTLKIVVVGLGVLIFAGLALIIGRILYVASHSARDAGPDTSPVLAIAADQRLDLPPGAEVRSVSLSGNRLAVHYDAGGTAGIAVLDLATGRRITTIEVGPKGAGLGN